MLKTFDIRQEVFYAEADWKAILKEVDPEKVKFADVPRFPEVRRDLALVLEREVRFSDLEALAYKTGKGLLKAVNLFDVYEGEKIEAGKKSYAISFILQDNTKTLTDKEIDKIMQRLADGFEREFGAVIRK